METPTQDPQKSQPSRKKHLNSYAKYSAMGIQMGVIIGICSYLGIRIDEYFGTTPYWTAGLALIGVFVAIYFLLKDVLKTK